MVEAPYRLFFEDHLRAALIRPGSSVIAIRKVVAKQTGWNRGFCKFVPFFTEQVKKGTFFI